MTLRLHEIHPSLVHYPLALLPAALVLDLFGRASDNAALMTAGRCLMPAAAIAGAASALAGLAAQEAVQVPDDAHDLLVTHRNLNAGLVGLIVTLAAVRQLHARPGVGYLLAGFAGVAAMNYTAYLGGKMVYAKGIGVEPAQGVRPSSAQELRPATLGTFATTFLSNVGHAIRHAAKHLAKGDIAPALRRDSGR